MNARPQRKFKGDRLLNPDSTPDQIKCDYALAPMDRLATQMDAKWGIDRLPELVSVETAQKYGTAMAQLNEAIEKNDPALCAHKAQVCIRGLNAMDAEATRAGHKPASGDYLETEYEGRKIGILKDGAEWQAAKDARPDLEFFTLREAAIAFKVYRESKFVSEAKRVFPGANVTEYRPKQTPMGKLIDDQIPFAPEVRI